MLLNELMNWGSGNTTRRKEGTEYPIMRLHEEIDRMFDTFFQDFPSMPGLLQGKERGFMPRVNVIEKEKEIRIEAELPGIEEKDLEINIDNGMLTISGEKKSEKEDRKDNYYMMERSYGAFRRQLPLPAETDRDHVKAEFKNGVLSITVPKTEEAKSKVKKIPINAA